MKAYESLQTFQGTALPALHSAKEEPCRTATKAGSEPNRRQAGPSEAIKKSKVFSVPVRRLHNQNPILRILFILSSFRNLPLTSGASSRAVALAKGGPGNANFWAQKEKPMR